MQYARNNKELEMAVNRGLAAAKQRGVAEGARIMRQEAVPITVATRVLLRPQSRRAGDWRN